MTKPKKYAQLKEMRDHLINLGYPQHIINATMEKNPWTKHFARIAPNGTNSEKPT